MQINSRRSIRNNGGTRQYNVFSFHLLLLLLLLVRTSVLAIDIEKLVYYHVVTMEVHGESVLEVFKLEKKVKRISVRVPSSWKSRLEQADIKISEVVRSALWMALCKCEIDSPGARKITSKEAAARLFNALSEVRVRTITPDSEKMLINFSDKLAIFSTILLRNAHPEDLIALGEFMNQGEYAEEILREVYRNDSNTIR
jgi:hypothetical protein